MTLLNNRYLGVALVCSAVLAANSATATVYSCERYGAEPSGFSSMAAFDSWFPKAITLNTDTGEKDGNQLVFKSTYQMSGSDNFIVHTTRLLPNGKAISGLAPVGGFRQTGQARYKCTSLTQ